MRKCVLIAIVLLVIVASFSTAQVRGGAALGIQGNIGWSNYAGIGGTSLTFKFPSLPIMWGLGVGFGPGHLHLGVTADWWVLNDVFGSSPFAWYLGFGLFGGMYGNTVTWDGAIGGRVPIGLQLWLFKLIPDLPNKLELFLEFAPSLGVSFGAHGFSFPSFGLGGAVGVRWWF